MSGELPRILIRDDGELDEVRRVLDELRIEYAESSKGDPGPLPSQMLISAGPWAVDAVKQLVAEHRERDVLHLIVIDRASRSLRAMLERYGCDMIARRPLHPSVIRLLVQRALFRGEEKRSEERVVIGETVKLRAGLLSRAVTLAELSGRGCGLITSQALPVGTEVQITLGRDLTGGAVLSLPARVVGASGKLLVERGQYAAALVFTSLKQGQQRQLRQIMRARAVGRTGSLEHGQAATTSRGSTRDAPAGPGAAPPSAASRTPGDPHERRRAPRGHYSESVLARLPGATHSLLGRDLSLGGMRVAPDSLLGPGDRLQLAIFGQGGIRPVMVIAEVVRDDGEQGLGLRFEPLCGRELARLERIVAALDGLTGSGSRTGIVVSEVLEIS